MLGIAEDGDNSFELEYMLKEPYWGKGYATALVREQVGIIRNSYPKSCITAMTDVQNIASIKVLTKNGFSLTKSLINDKGNEVYCFCLEG